MLLQQGVQAVIDLVQSTAQDFETDVLANHPCAQFFEAADEDGDGAGDRALGECFFPFGFIVDGLWAVEWDGSLGDGVVEIGAEGGVGGERVPF